MSVLSLFLVDHAAATRPSQQQSFRISKESETHYQIHSNPSEALESEEVTLHLLLKEVDDNDSGPEHTTRIQAKVYVTSSGRNIFFSVPKVPNEPRIHSNPVSEYVKFVNLSSSISYTYEAYTISGESVLQGTLRGDKMIDLQHLSDGKYILVLQDAEGVEVLRTRFLVIK